MAVFPQLERMFWFHDHVKRQRFPNAAHLAKQFEISHKTAQRNICCLRDRLLAPIAYDHAHKGYYYTDDSFELSRFAATQEEVLAVLVARRLLSRAVGGFISEAFRGFSRKLHDVAAGLGMDEERLEEAFSSSWHGYSPAPEAIFGKVAKALMERRIIEIDYHSPGSSANSRRRIEPHHLQHYMASWVLIAYCRLRQSWRKFYLSRIDRLQVLPETFKQRPREQWAHQLEDSFGIFQGPSSIPVTLRFNPFRSRWVREQLWHPAQQVRETKDGCIEISFPVADFREVKMMILQFGADVQVLSPDALRDEIGAEVARMMKMYRLS
jgi:predicted DNA-binding transcriptional regulator YafY